MQNLITSSTGKTTASLDLTLLIRGRIRESIEDILYEELAIALGAEKSERTDERKGYRNGAGERRLITELGPLTITVPRGRILSKAGQETEWRSPLLPRYMRRTERVNEAILGCYLAGANSRRIRRALAPLFGRENLSKSTVSRIVAKLKERFDAWREQELSGQDIVYLFLDAIRLPVRLARRVVRVPVLAALGVRSDGSKVLLSLTIAGGESLGAWKGLVGDLARRGLAAPLLVAIDGNQGLSRAVRETWPEAAVQRCMRHKLENLLAHAPKHAHEEIKRDYHEIMYGKTPALVRQALGSFRVKWQKLCPPVARSLDEAGDELITYVRFPKSQWSVLRTTNHLERLNGEFRRRTKTQGSFATEQAALTLLWGLVASGQVKLYKIKGAKDMPLVNKADLSKAA